MEREEDLKKEIKERWKDKWLIKKESKCWWEKLVDESFQAGQLASNEQIELARESGYNEGCYVTEKKEKERCLKMIEEMKGAYPNRIEWNVCLNNLKQELTKKINEVEK